MRLSILAVLILSLAAGASAQRREGPNTDVHYRLGPDPLAQDGVPKG